MLRRLGTTVAAERLASRGLGIVHYWDTTTVIITVKTTMCPWPLPHGGYHHRDCPWPTKRMKSSEKFGRYRPPALLCSACIPPFSIGKSNLATRQMYVLLLCSLIRLHTPVFDREIQPCATQMRIGRPLAPLRKFGFPFFYSGSTSKKQ